MFDGCNDKDEDGIPDYADKCPNKKETINGVDDEDGCPDKGKRLVIIRKGKIEINQRIYFATGKADIESRSFALLDQIALTLKATPRLKKIRIEGHTDSQGSVDGSRRLSERLSGWK
ncbi:MAG: OmpA family protein [Deltaproteobacteria bacterium]|nr:OmpA family protein [Deltaproteobacteria bacterium]